MHNFVRILANSVRRHWAQYSKLTIVGMSVFRLACAEAPSGSQTAAVAQPSVTELPGIIPSATPTSTSSACIKPTSFPPPPVGGMTYSNWQFGSSVQIKSIEHSIHVGMNPGATSNIYLQLYDANIDSTGQYYGLQTTGLALFSRWGVSDTSNIILGPNAYTASGSEIGTAFISLRRNFGSLPVGDYSTRMTRTTFDGVGDWFAYYVTFPGGSEQYIGSIRFPRTNAAVPATFKDRGGTWTEFWSNNGMVLYPVPLWSGSVKVTANSGASNPISVVNSYSTMPNSDVYLQGGKVNISIGGMTERCHPAGTYPF